MSLNMGGKIVSDLEVLMSVMCHVAKAYTIHNPQGSVLSLSLIPVYLGGFL